MSSSEVTEVFFGVTKLFQSSDASLRRMIYFFIKEVAETCNPDDIIIVTSSLTKDMNSKEDLFRANSIRVLAKMYAYQFWQIKSILQDRLHHAWCNRKIH